MLLEKYGGQADQHGDTRKHRPPQGRAEPAAVPAGGQTGHGPDDMDRGADVGIGVKGVEPGHKPGQHIVPGEVLRPQLLAGGEEKVEDHGDRIGQDDKPHHLPEAVHLAEEGVGLHPDQEDEPEQIGQDEPLTEGDQIVQEYMDRRIDVGDAHPLHKGKEQAEERPEEEQLDMGILRRVQVPKPEPPVIENLRAVHTRSAFHRAAPHNLARAFGQRFCLIRKL